MKNIIIAGAVVWLWCIGCGWLDGDPALGVAMGAGLVGTVFMVILCVDGIVKFVQWDEKRNAA